MEDTATPFLQIPWIAHLLSQPNTTLHNPASRTPKPTLEDSLFAEILATPRTIRSCIAFYQDPSYVQIAILLGDGMNGHPAILHGGVTATLCDEAAGMFQGVTGTVGTFTVELKVRYLRPVKTPGAVVVGVRRVRKEGRKEWLSMEVRQEDDSGKVVVCAVGEALFVEPKNKVKL